MYKIIIMLTGLLTVKEEGKIGLKLHGVLCIPMDFLSEINIIYT